MIGLKPDIEYALLLRIVQEQDFDKLLKNDINESTFGDSGRVLFRHIRDYINTYNTYMHPNQILQMFNIEPEKYTSLMTLGETQFLINTLKEMNASERINNTLQTLNTLSPLAETRPYEYIKQFSNINDDLQKIGWVHQPVNIIDNLDNVLQLDRNNVIPTGFKEMDERIGGWCRGEELAILMGRPGQGKSMILMYSALAAAKQGFKVAIYSGEMSEDQVGKRLIALNKNGRAMTESESISEMRRLNLQEQFSLYTPMQLGGKRANINDLTELVAKADANILFVDQLSLVDDIHKGVYDTKTRFANISADLFNLSITRQIPVILAVQSNRDGSLRKDAPRIR